MRLWVVIFFLCVLLGIGCSGGQFSNPVDVDAVQDSRMSTSDDGHRLWGYYDISISADLSSAQVYPRRAGAMHLNARSFLEDSPCQDCLSVTGITIEPGNILNVDITLRHPFPGVMMYTGFDVRGIAMFNGSYMWPGAQVLMSDSALGDIELLNPDGYTRLFNPMEYPPGSGAGPLDEYSKGKMAPPGEPNSLVNGYKNYFSDADRRYFLPGDAVTRTYRIKAKPGGFVFGYAVDANWQPPTGSPPYTVPDDFPLGANMPEAYELSFAYQPGMKSDGSGASFLTVDAYDWQDPADVVMVRGECPDVFNGVKDFVFDSTGVGYARYKVALTNSMGAPEGDYRMLVWATDVKDASNPKHLVAVSITTISVDEQATIPTEPVLITVINEPFHSPFCAKVDPVSDKCYVNSTQLSPTFDPSIRSIDADENVEMFFMKTMFAGGFFGLNPSNRKICAPDFPTLFGSTDYLDLDGGPNKNFFLPVDPTQGAAFLYDGETFATPNKACAVDSITDRLIIWNPSQMIPEYSEISTANFPTSLEADYDNGRLFVYCFGDASVVAPGIEVYDMASEGMISSFNPVHTQPPFWTDLDYDPASGYIFFGAGSGVGYVEVWDTSNYQFVKSIETPLTEVIGVVYFNGFLYLTGQIGGVGKLLMMDAETDSLLYELDCGDNPTMLAINPNNKKIYVPDLGGQSVWVWQG